MSAYDKGSEDVNMLLEILKDQAVKVNDYNEKANTALDKELRDIMLHYRKKEIKAMSKTLNILEEKMPEFNKYLAKYLSKDGAGSRSKDDIGIGDLK